jgi:hypothetical protein
MTRFRLANLTSIALAAVIACSSTGLLFAVATVPAAPVLTA